MRWAADPSPGSESCLNVRVFHTKLENHVCMDLDVCVTVRSFTKLDALKFCKNTFLQMWKVSRPKHEKQSLNQKHTKIMSTYFRPQCLYKGNGIDILVILGSEVDLYIYKIVHYMYLMVWVSFNPFWFYIWHSLPLDITPEHQYLRQKQTGTSATPPSSPETAVYPCSHCHQTTLTKRVILPCK